MYIVARIHNQSLGAVREVENEEAGKLLIRDLFFAQFGRPLDPDETDMLEDTFEVINEEDPDNHYTFSLALVES